MSYLIAYLFELRSSLDSIQREQPTLLLAVAHQRSPGNLDTLIALQSSRMTSFCREWADIKLVPKIGKNILY